MQKGRFLVLGVPVFAALVVACSPEPEASSEATGDMLATAAAQLSQPEHVLVPIGGGYGTFDGYAATVARTARGGKVKMIVLPPAYGEDKATAIANGDYKLAEQHVKELRTACRVVVDPVAFPNGCKVDLVDWFTTADGSAPAVLSAINDAQLDGIYFLGGVQDGAMIAMAGTPGEAALNQAYDRGVVIGGTSAGDAILSRVMNNGYTAQGDYSTATQIGSLDIWFGGASDPLHRGLVFGLEGAIADQHVDERGRFARLLNETAQSADRLGDGGLVTIGHGADTSTVIKNNDAITDVWGPGSVAIVDYRSTRTRHSWVDANGDVVPNADPITTPTAALSAKAILTHLLAGKPSPQLGSAVRYDIASRLPSLNGTPYPVPNGYSRNAHTANVRLSTSSPLILGGDLTFAPNWPAATPALTALASRATGAGPIYIVTVAYDTHHHAKKDADNYAAALTASGWSGQTKILFYGESNFTTRQIDQAAGVLLIGQNQALLGPALADAAFTAWVRDAANRAPVVMTDHAMTAAAGDVYDAIDDAADWIEAFQASQAVLQPGLGLVKGPGKVAFEPRVAYDYRWGRLYGIANASPAQQRPVVYAIEEATAIIVECGKAEVTGAQPVVVADSTWATYYVGENGAIGAFNVVLDVFEPGQSFGH